MRGFRGRRFQGLALLFVVLVVASVAGRDGGGNGNSERHKAGSSQRSHPQARQPRRHDHRRRTAVRASACPSRSRALDGVYHPERLGVIDPCRAVRGRVIAFKREEDGDLHMRLRPLRPRRGLLAAANFSQQRGALVVELMPRDRRHLPAPRVGDRLDLVGAFVEDLDHSWNELHPVWQMRVNGGRRHRSGPQFGGSPSGARSKNAVVSCRTMGGRRCTPYQGPSSYLTPGSGPAGSRDCSDFRTRRDAQRYFLSKGGPARDSDRLDGDHDGRACELLPD